MIDKIVMHGVAQQCVALNLKRARKMCALHADNILSF